MPVKNQWWNIKLSLRMHQIAGFDFYFCKNFPREAPPDPHQWEGETPSHTHPRAALPRRIASRCSCLPQLSEDLPLLSHVGETLVAVTHIQRLFNSVWPSWFSLHIIFLRCGKRTTMATPNKKVLYLYKSVTTIVADGYCCRSMRPPVRTSLRPERRYRSL